VRRQSKKTACDMRATSLGTNETKGVKELVESARFATEGDGDALS